VFAEERAGDLDVFRRGPTIMEMGGPDVDGVEAERGDFGEHGVETFTESRERAEVVVGGGVALAPAARHLIAELAGDEVGGHKGKWIHGEMK